MLEQIEELQLDLIEIINPIGEVLEEVENEFIEFEYAFMRSFKFELIDELKTIIIKITDPICDLLEEVENKFVEFKRRNYNIIKVCQKNNNIT
tara:strand:- start:556 stop:834 length:279 start_codon:yes stop_codon:yes gene_type:complete